MMAEIRNSQILRTTALLIAVCLVSFPAQAQYGGGTGEPDDPYQIATAEDLNDIGNHPEDWDKCFVLVSDIDMAAFSYATALIAPDTNSTKWAFQGTPFTGIFDGNGHIITDLTIETKGADNDYLGLFGYIDKSGQVKNLGIEDANIASGSGSGYLGGLAGSNGYYKNGYYKSGGGTIINCYSTGRISGDWSVGGLVGSNEGAIIHCYSSGTVSGSGSSVGGLVGYNGGDVTHCWSTGAVNGEWNVAGLVGGNNGAVTHCWSTGAVGGEWNVAGLAGGNDGAVTHCYSTSPVNAKSSAGGLVGGNEGAVACCYSTGTVSGGSGVGGLVGVIWQGTVLNCYSTSPVNGKDSIGGLVGRNYNGGSIATSYSTGAVGGNEHVGGLVGSGDPDHVSHSFWDMLTSGQTTTAGGIGKTTTEMQTASTFLDAGWDFLDETKNGREDIWWILEGQDYPRLVRKLSAFSPHPQDGAIDVIQPLILNWVAGASALHHDIYFGEDEDAVANATTESPVIYRGRQAAEMTTYDARTLELVKTYYWRIDEVNEADPGSPWKGSVWSFTTANFIVVDDFEGYDDFCNRIFYTWLDGWGFSGDPDCGVPAYPGNGTGSTVGFWHMIGPEPFGHSGEQSMPFEYYNSGTVGKARYSEAQREWAVPQNWARDDVKALTLWFHGTVGNAPERLYVALEDSTGQIRVVTHPDPQAVQAARWQEWNIELTQFSEVNLAAINKLYIGLGNRVSPAAGGSGKIYIDDIRLYRPRCIASILKPEADLSGNCVVDLADIEILASQWLQSGAGLTADSDADGDVDLGDFAQIADAWLEELLWPQA